MKNIPAGKIHVRSGELLRRENANRSYMMRLESADLLSNYYIEAGLSALYTDDVSAHTGWEHPSCQLRGHFLGHWLSAAAMRYAASGDMEIKARADFIVDELARCQAENGDGWAASIPEKYFHWIARGKNVWAPHYTVHKLFMGLVDMYLMAGSEKALKIAHDFAGWFHRWTMTFTRDQMDDILDFETGGMLEIWAEMYRITRDGMYLDLMERYYRGRLFDRLLAGEDPLTNMHANTTIPEIMGCVRAYEVTGEEKYRKIAEAYWKCAVTDRGTYATGGQTCGEIWTPKLEMRARLGEKNQEHCTVYNMMRLADALLRWTGESVYGDYIEKNLYNGIFAQAYWKGSFTHGARSDYPDHALLTYFLPLHGGARKGWAGEKDAFFCCHGTLVQANADLGRYIAYCDDNSVTFSQYFDSDVTAAIAGQEISLSLREDSLSGSVMTFSTNSASQTLSGETICRHLPGYALHRIAVKCAAPAQFTLKVRIPGWCAASAEVYVNDNPAEITMEKGFACISRLWNDGDTVQLILPRSLRAEALPDDPSTVAFCYGPITLAALCDEERTLYADDPAHPENMLRPDNEREWGSWKYTFRTTGQMHGLRLVPLMNVGYDGYSVYFPIEKK